MKACILLLLILSVSLTSCSPTYTESSTNQQTVESELNTAPEKDDKSTPVEKNEFTIIHQPEELDELLGKLEKQLREMCDSKEITVTKDIPSGSFVLNAENDIKLDNALKSSSNEYLYIIEVKASDESSTQVICSSRLKLYYKLKELNKPDVFYMEVSTERFLDPLIDEIKISEKTNQCFNKMRGFLSDTHLSALAGYFLLPDLDYNNPIYTYSNGIIEKIFIEGGGFESCYYIYKQK